MSDQNNFITPGGVFNQASLLMLRLNNLFVEIDRASMQPLLEIRPGYFNYNSIAENLNSAYKSIQGKLTKGEKDLMEKKMEVIEMFIIQNPPRITRHDYLGKIRKCTDFTAWIMLNKLLNDFRRSIEDLMEKYKLGNPSKKDPTTSIVD